MAEQKKTIEGNGVPLRLKLIKHQSFASLDFSSHSFETTCIYTKVGSENFYVTLQRFKCYIVGWNGAKNLAVISLASFYFPSF